MWTILKFEKREFSFLKKDFQKKLGNDLIFYSPKILIEKNIKNNIIKKKYSVLGDYIFLYHNKINCKILNYLKFSRGLNYFLQGFLTSQKEIVFFIDRCKKLDI